jgi:hypothetical protein
MVFPPATGAMRDKSGNDALSEVLLKRREISVVPKSPNRSYGSLYEPGHSRNQLFADHKRNEVNSYLDIAVVLNRQLKPRLANENNGAQNAPDGQGGGQAPAVASDAGGQPDTSDLDKILPKQFPHLDGGKENPLIPRSLRFKILRRYDNGDALVAFNRVTENDNETKVLDIKAKLPASALAKKEITTADLVEVDFGEVNQGEFIERRSSGWEDEYTLLVGGFSEAQSRLAQDLDARTKQLDAARAQLAAKLESFGKERNSVAKERERLAKEREEVDKKLSELQQTVEDQQKTIEDLKPIEQKPGDAKEGAKK